jgi:hypothetical protein
MFDRHILYDMHNLLQTYSIPRMTYAKPQYQEENRRFYTILNLENQLSNFCHMERYFE